MDIVCGDFKGGGDLDFVLVGILKPPNTSKALIKVAFVSTNSITQGEQVGILWPDIQAIQY